MNTSFSEVTDYLEELARKGKRASYNELLEHFGLRKIDKDRKWKDTEIYQFFGIIESEDQRCYRPLRTSVVVLKKGDKLTVPSAGYFEILSRYRNCDVPVGMREKRALHAAELARLEAYYSRSIGTLVEPTD